MRKRVVINRKRRREDLIYNIDMSGSGDNDLPFSMVDTLNYSSSSGVDSYIGSMSGDCYIISFSDGYDVSCTGYTSHNSNGRHFSTTKEEAN